MTQEDNNQATLRGARRRPAGLTRWPPTRAARQRSAPPRNHTLPSGSPGKRRTCGTRHPRAPRVCCVAVLTARPRSFGAMACLLPGSPPSAEPSVRLPAGLSTEKRAAGGPVPAPPPKQWKEASLRSRRATSTPWAMHFASLSLRLLEQRGRQQAVTVFTYMALMLTSSLKPKYILLKSHLRLSAQGPALGHQGTGWKSQGPSDKDARGMVDNSHHCDNTRLGRTSAAQGPASAASQQSQHQGCGSWS